MLLNLFDFDGTLFRTPGREEGSRRYLEATGDHWPFEGWWGRGETLISPILPSPHPADFKIAWVHDAYQRCREEPGRTILMTGRPYKIKHIVENILEQYGLSFDKTYFRGQLKASDTFGFKKAALQIELAATEYDEIHIWEDRMEHVVLFKDLAQELKPKVSIHYVSDEEQGPSGI